MQSAHVRFIRPWPSPWLSNWLSKLLLTETTTHKHTIFVDIRLPHIERFNSQLADRRDDRTRSQASSRRNSLHPAALRTLGRDQEALSMQRPGEWIGSGHSAGRGP